MYFLLLLLWILRCVPLVNISVSSTAIFEAGLRNEVDKRKISNHYVVIGIKDGDTIVVLMEGKAQTVRLAHIDCPERKQPFANRAKQLASSLCFGKAVRLVNEHKFDRNMRLISEVVLLDGTSVNKELVRNGLAWHFKKYSNATVYAKLEIEARQKRVGLWSDPSPIAPWNWRKGQR